jgi:hypothetical protein
MKTHILLFFLHALSPTFAQVATKWEFKGQKDGITLYHQRTDGLLHIKVAFSLESSLAGIATMFADLDTYTDWGYKIVEARLLRRVSDTEFYYYAKYDFPWPMSDRDIILHSKLKQDPVSKVVTIVNTPLPSYLPEKKGIERIRRSTTQWRFVPGKTGWVYTEQVISTDSAENLPEWLVTMTVDTGPRETAKGIRRVLRTERFRMAKLRYIQE